MTSLQLIVFACAIIPLNFYATLKVMIAIRAKGQPWELGVPGIGGTVALSGSLLTTNQDVNLKLFGLLLYLLGYALILLPKVWDLSHSDA